MADAMKYEVQKGGRWVEVDRDSWRGWNGVRRATRISGDIVVVPRGSAAAARSALKKSPKSASNWVLTTNSASKKEKKR